MLKPNSSATCFYLFIIHMGIHIVKYINFYYERITGDEPLYFFSRFVDFFTITFETLKGKLHFYAVDITLCISWKGYVNTFACY